MQTTRWSRVAAAMVLTGATASAAVASLPAGPADAAAQGAVQGAAASGPTSVSVFLMAPHAAALARLAAQPVVDRDSRLRALARLVPDAAQHATVVHRLKAEGLRVTSQSAWSVTATAPASVVGSLFGTRPVLPAVPSAADVRAATGALPRVPGALSGLVSGVFPTTGGPAAYHRAATSSLTGADVRKADTPARVAPSKGTKDSGLTIATLQLATFSSSDLTHYARSHHLADPVAAGRYRAVEVDGGPGVGDALGGGDIEVDLDQESLLSTAPSARQQAYFAPNTNAGFADVFSSVYDDATGDKMATAPNKHIVAMSVSWGECEALTGARSIGVLEPILQSVVASGVTVFASAGDSGIYDCGSTNGTGSDNSVADVDFPASSPFVVSVGGTRLSASSSTPNTGRTWAERTWSCTSPSSCQNTTTGTGGGGGGVSGNAFGRSSGGATGDFRGFRKPLYQRRAVTSRPYAKVATRMAPDIAADGDPATGFVVYTSDPMYVALFLGNTGTVGGTSLASPLSAAQLANTLGDAGRTTGVGDVHGALYSAYHDTVELKVTDRRKAFRDVVRGSIGAQGDRGKDPSVSATPGYDIASGLGGVLWSALTPYLLEKRGPALTAHLSTAGHHTGARRTVQVRWRASRGHDRILVGLTNVQVRQAGRHQVTAYTANHGSRRLTVRRGARLTMRVATVDIAGHLTARTVHLHVR